jgi:UDPglucose 6-dehydrogenase
MEGGTEGLPEKRGQTMNICIVGTGYVGLVTGACLAEFGMNTICIDKDSSKIGMLSKGKIPFYEPGLENLVEKNVAQGRLRFSGEIKQGVQSSLVIYIAVGTPANDDGTVDLRFVKGVAEDIAKYMNGYKVVVVKSTVPVGTCQQIKAIIQENRPEAYNFDVVSNPEFQREGSAIEDFMRPDRVTIGAESEQAIAIMRDIYSALYLNETPFVITNLETAEMIKYAANAFLATKITFINEIATLCEKVGADIHFVARAMGLDGRIGRKFLHPGPGYGGSCFPKDTVALLNIGRRKGCELRLVDSVIKANDEQRLRMVEKIRGMVGALQRKTIGVLGISFKPNTSDVRESSSIIIIQRLQAEGAKIKAYDPAAMDEAKAILPDIHYCADPYEVAEGCDALVLLTEWNQFRRLDLDRLRELMKTPIFVDLRNVYEPSKMREAGFRYCGVGR